ncbi:MAG: monovalent cation/H+ antiporter complex subunit F [Candidatus Omnitrophica bacterium]|nr:monovalent cation/H+ antiporter complex subunit F [Candidatus Omnitrophota bacterium]MCM8816561.1 monovalent cation/H+ antiporter complex subunit F [Candidatus Omnitrophota bacterium]
MINLLIVILTCCSFLCLFRIARGPSASDRAVAIDILGIMIVAFGAFMSIKTGKEFYLTTALVWALLNFIGVLALAKFLEGKGFDD